MKQVITKRSGIIGFRARLSEVYGSFACFEAYNHVYGLVYRLGYKIAENAWEANPIIEGSVNSCDFRRVRWNEKTKVK